MMLLTVLLIGMLVALASITWAAEYLKIGHLMPAAMKQRHDMVYLHELVHAAAARATPAGALKECIDFGGWDHPAGRSFARTARLPQHAAKFANALWVPRPPVFLSEALDVRSPLTVATLSSRISLKVLRVVSALLIGVALYAFSAARAPFGHMAVLARLASAVMRLTSRLRGNSLFDRGAHPLLLWGAV